MEAVGELVPLGLLLQLLLLQELVPELLDRLEGPATLLLGLLLIDEQLAYLFL